MVTASLLIALLGVDRPVVITCLREPSAESSTGIRLGGQHDFPTSSIRVTTTADGVVVYLDRLIHGVGFEATIVNVDNQLLGHATMSLVHDAIAAPEDSSPNVELGGVIVLRPCSQNADNVRMAVALFGAYYDDSWIPVSLSATIILEDMRQKAPEVWSCIGLSQQGIRHSRYSVGSLMGEGWIDEDGNRSGIWTVKDLSENLVMQETYENGTRNGLWATYDAATKLCRMQGFFCQDAKVGTWVKYYSVSGGVYRVEDYVNGQKSGMFFEYDTQGRLRAKGRQSAGRRMGEWAFIDESGQRKTIDYGL